MQSHYGKYHSIEAREAILHVASDLPGADGENTDAATTHAPTQFHTHHIGCMEMDADAQTVANYLNAHQGWFSRCAHPMIVEPLTDNSYALVVGRFGSFGYEVEPKIGLELLPANQGIYRIRTVPVPGYVTAGYEVDYQASMQLVEEGTAPLKIESSATRVITRVEWQLDLTVDIHFPKFIQRLPKSVIQNTGDRLLNQIVRQVSRRLTQKVQEDFHQSLKLPFPFKSSKKHS